MIYIGYCDCNMFGVKVSNDTLFGGSINQGTRVI